MVCEKCGTTLIDGVCPKCVQQETTETNSIDIKIKKIFVSPQEKLVSILGNSYVENFLHSGAIQNGFAVVSNKRCYFNGKQYYINENGDIEETYQSRIVDLRDVTGTGFDSYQDKSWLIFSIVHCVIFVVLFIFAFVNLVLGMTAGITGSEPVQVVDGVISSGGGERILAAVLFIADFFVLGIILFCYFRYKKSKLSLIMIQYAGGEIGFDLRWFKNREIELFQKHLRLAKDKVFEKDDTPVIIEKQMNSVTSVADELSKLASLLEKGLITSDEFDKMKKELI